MVHADEICVTIYHRHRFCVTLAVCALLFCVAEGPTWNVRAQTIKSVGKVVFWLSFINFFPKTISAVEGITLSVQTRRNPRYVTASNLLPAWNRRTERNHKQTGIRSVYVKHWESKRFDVSGGGGFFWRLVSCLNSCLCNGTCVTPRLRRGITFSAAVWVFSFFFLLERSGSAPSALHPLATLHNFELSALKFSCSNHSRICEGDKLCEEEKRQEFVFELG